MTELDKIRSEVAGYRYSDFLRQLPVIESLGIEARPLRVAVLRTYTIESIEPVLKLRLLLEGFATELFFGGFGQFVQEILDESSTLYEFQPDLVLVMTRLEDLMPDFVDSFVDRTADDWRDSAHAKAAELGDLVELLRSRQPAEVLVQNFSPPARPYWGLYDAQTSASQAALVSTLNQALVEKLEALPGAFVWDFDGFVRRTGYERLFDDKMWFVARAPYSQSMIPDLVGDLMPYVRSIFGPTKKCLVLDLDNTLWGGVIGEDGLEGIALGHEYPGSCFRDFQKELLKLHRRGLILAVNSKNNEADALEALERHPDMVLRPDHFAAMKINWQDKASNLRDLAATLNIGLDSMIMIDDNPVECEQIRQALPECDVVCLPNEPYLIPHIVSELPGVENIRLTDEDKQKGAMYRAQAARAEHAKSYADLDDFLASLDIQVEISGAEPFSVPRIAQLTQKTNQMNLTTRRYTEAEIIDTIDDPSRAAFSIAARDKFGDNGIIGVVILEFDGSDCRIDTFLLSCRVIGRKIEDAMMAFIADFAERRGAKRLIGEFFPTPKNAPAASMYDGMGFERLAETRFSADLSEHQFASPPFIALKTVEEEDRALSESA